METLGRMQKRTFSLSYGRIKVQRKNYIPHTNSRGENFCANANGTAKRTKIQAVPYCIVGTEAIKIFVKLQK
jgi:hypothetical protein